MKPKYYILIIIILTIIAGGVYLYVHKTPAGNKRLGYLGPEYSDYPAPEYLNFQNYPEYLLDTEKIETFFGVICKDIELLENGTKMIANCYEKEYNNAEFLAIFHLMKNYVSPCTDSCNCEIDFDNHIVIERVIRTVGKYDEENPTTWIYDTTNGKSCSWEKFELLNFKDYPQYALDINKVEKMLDIKCINFKSVDDKIYEAICSEQYYDPKTQGFLYKFRLKKYSDFQPCKPCPDCYDYACDCDTNFRNGIVWEMTKRSMMEFITLIDVNSEEIICVRGEL